MELGRVVLFSKDEQDEQDEDEEEFEEEREGGRQARRAGEKILNHSSGGRIRQFGEPVISSTQYDGSFEDVESSSRPKCSVIGITSQPAALREIRMVRLRE